jgi:Tfp pilus assembly protein PilV
MQALKGLTLVETLIAVTILTIAIVGPYHAIQTAMNVSYVSRDQLIATALAQESLEYVRSVRDSNFAYNVANPSTAGTWLYGFDGSTRNSVAGKGCFSPVNCTVDVANVVSGAVSAIAQCSGAASTCPALNLSPALLYTQGAGTATKYTRWITFTTINSHEVRVDSSVTWKTLGVTYTITISNFIQNWL